MNQQEALNWIADIFDESPDTLTPETLREDIPAWDSMGVLMLMAEMDEKFSIVLTDVDIKSMRKVGDIIALLSKHDKLTKMP